MYVSLFSWLQVWKQSQSCARRLSSFWHATASDVSSLFGCCLFCLERILACALPTVETTGELSEIAGTDTMGLTGIGSICCPLDEDAACEATCPIISSRCALPRKLSPSMYIEMNRTCGVSSTTSSFGTRVFNLLWFRQVLYHGCSFGNFVGQMNLPIEPRRGNNTSVGSPWRPKVLATWSFTARSGNM